MTSYLALQGEEPRSMLGRVASLGDGVAASLGKLLSPQPRTAPAPRAEAHRPQSPPAAQVLRMDAPACRFSLEPPITIFMLRMTHSRPGARDLAPDAHLRGI